MGHPIHKLNMPEFAVIGCDTYFKDRGQCVFKVPRNKNINKESVSYIYFHLRTLRFYKPIKLHCVSQ